ncbi:porin family protein [Porphyromonas sp. oral taxon 275]|uniref:porin family protein n=1 Tax=Porphyromonas sp. oral taxon 275 TaxID=712435 RepID=UPI001BA7A7BE|nr:porin family protein [Porphyromonas sp. oral taxon 275]QUB43515.1 PorT family protein [Porphyromonas sp. oral taxon 275]
MIRTLCYSLLVLGLAATTASTQEAKPPFHQSLAVGVHGGMLMSRINFVPSVSQRLHSGLMGGVLLRYNVERGASLQLEANYVQGGWREKYDAATTSYSRTLNALEVPLLTHLYLGQGSAKFYLNAGPFVGYILSEASTSSGEDAMSDQDKVRHALPVANRFFWGLGGGPGLSLQLGGRHRIELEGRLVYGLGNIWSSARTSPYPQSSELRFGARLSYVIQL